MIETPLMGAPVAAFVIVPWIAPVVAGGVAVADMALTNDGKDYVLDFDGEDDFVVVEDNPVLDLSSGSFTIEFYCRATIFNSTQANGVNDRWNIAVTHGTSNDDLDYMVGFEDGQPTFFVRSYKSGFTSDTKLQPGQWYHIAFVQDVENSLLKIYIDGELDSQSPLKGVAVKTEGDVFIGAREFFGSGNGSHFFNGVLYELRMWNKARSKSEIFATMNASLQGNETNLVGYWPMNDGTGTTVRDISQEANFGETKGGIIWERIIAPLKP